jgi:GT2 family glycosyltransferase
VVLDACTDRSAQVASVNGTEIVISTAKNVGKARALGAEHALAAGARWLAFTDGDSEVPADWLSRQLAPAADAVCGIVSIQDWSPHSPLVKRRYLQRYNSRDGHRHIHGANFGVSASAYRAAGGFSPIAVHEDVALVRALEKVGATIAWVANPCVTTNSRSVGRLLGGFACYLRKLATREAPAPYPVVAGNLLAGS